MDAGTKAILAIGIGVLAFVGYKFAMRPPGLTLPAGPMQAPQTPLQQLGQGSGNNSLANLAGAGMAIGAGAGAIRDLYNSIFK